MCEVSRVAFVQFSAYLAEEPTMLTSLLECILTAYLGVYCQFLSASHQETLCSGIMIQDIEINLRPLLFLVMLQLPFTAAKLIRLLLNQTMFGFDVGIEVEVLLVHYRIIDSLV